MHFGERIFDCKLVKVKDVGEDFLFSSGVGPPCGSSHTQRGRWRANQAGSTQSTTWVDPCWCL